MTKIGPVAWRLARREAKKLANFVNSAVESAWQNPCHPLDRPEGGPAQCVGAPLRASQKTWWLGPYSFWASCGIYLKGSKADRDFPLGAKVFRRFPEVHPVRDCRCRGLASRSRLNSKCLHRWGRPFWGDEPRDRFEPRQPGAAHAALGGQDYEERRPAWVRANPGTGGRSQPAVPALMTGRQPERACSGSSG